MLGDTKAPRQNYYDRLDRVSRESVMIAGPVRIAAYRVRDPENNDEFGPLQFHMTCDNHVMAVMSESAAELFAGFVSRTLEARRPKPDRLSEYIDARLEAEKLDT